MADQGLTIEPPPAGAEPAALITGSTSGIGAALAHAFAARGHRIVLVSNDGPGLERTAADLRSLGARVDCVEVDLCAAGSPAIVADRCRELDLAVLINNVGRGMDGPFLSQPLPDLLEMMQLNMNTMIALSRLLAARMIERRRGTIINVASVSAFGPAPNMAVYGATKAFVGSFTASLREELRGTGLRVVLLAPGITSGTRFFKNLQFNPIERRPELAISAEQAVAEAMAALDAGRDTIITGRRNRLRFWAQQISLRWFGRHAARFIRAMHLVK